MYLVIKRYIFNNCVYEHLVLYFSMENYSNTRKNHFPTHKKKPQHDKTNKMSVRPVCSESSLSAWRKLGFVATQWAHSEDSGQTGRMPRLIWVFAGRTLTLLVLSCCSSNIGVYHTRHTNVDYHAYLDDLLCTRKVRFWPRRPPKLICLCISDHVHRLRRPCLFYIKQVCITALRSGLLILAFLSSFKIIQVGISNENKLIKQDSSLLFVSQKWERSS